MGSVMSSRPAYRVTEVPGKGRGLVATRQIQPGEIILEERPLLLLDGNPLEISEETRAKLLTLHDLADNYVELISEGVDLIRLMAENKKLAVLLDDENDKIRRIIFCNGWFRSQPLPRSRPCSASKSFASSFICTRSS